MGFDRESRRPAQGEWNRRRAGNGSHSLRGEEIARERRLRGWNQYRGEEEEPEERGANNRQGASWNQDGYPAVRPDENELRFGMREQMPQKMPLFRDTQEPEDGIRNAQRAQIGEGMRTREIQPGEGWNAQEDQTGEGMRTREIQTGEGWNAQEKPQENGRNVPERPDPQRRTSDGAMQPYFRMPDDVQMLEEEQETERDLRRLQAMYPETARGLLPHIEEACDKLEYEGSAMFDGLPDRETVRRLAQEIYGAVKDEYPPEPEERPDELLTMQYQERDGKHGRISLKELIQMMLLQEMHHRRRRHRRITLYGA